MIPIADPEMGETEIESVVDCLEEGQLADGPEVRAFESEFSEYCGTDHGIATSNGTTALHTAFHSIGLGEGDRILTTPFSYIASANAIRLAGAEPVFEDIDPETYNLDPDLVEQRLERDGDIDAILVVHLYGLPCDMQRFQEIVDEYGVALIEDAAQAHGAMYDGQRVGTFGDAACFSFYPTKNMTTGEGGMVTTDRDDVAKAARRFVNHGRSDRYEHVELGHNFRMTSIEAAIGRAQLERLPEYTRQRQENAATLTRGLEGTAVSPPVEPSDRKHVYHQFTVRTQQREKVIDLLENNDIGYGVYYPTPIHRQEAYDSWNHDAPVAEQTSESVLSLPVHPNVSTNDLDRIVSVLEEVGT